MSLTFVGVFRRPVVAMLTALAFMLPAAQGAQQLPPEAQLALQRAGVPAEALSVVVHDATIDRRVLHWQEHKPLNPASLTKLLTTYAALDRLGPAFTWSTPVWITGPLKDGVLEGSVFIKGQGDPKLVLERVWLLLRRVRELGVRDIRGDIVLDNTAFSVPESEAGEFDGEPLRPYNVRASALLLNFRSVTYSFQPDEAAGVARVVAEPALAGLQVERSVPLATGACGDWRGALKASFEPGRAKFAGSYAASCGEGQWAVADPAPASYDARLVEALWRDMGGLLQGTVREGTAPAGLSPAFEQRSPPLAELVRDINKYSNNVMAQQLFYTLALQQQRRGTGSGNGTLPAGPVTQDMARETLLRWLLERSGAAAPGEVVLDNGSGLSRHTRLSALRLSRLLVSAFDSPVMSELMSSLPISGLDGTLRRSRTTPGRARMKTGSLRDVAGVAGYVLSNSGKRYAVVALINHPNANAARPALDAVVQWVLRDAPAR